MRTFLQKLNLIFSLTFCLLLSAEMSHAQIVYTDIADVVNGVGDTYFADIDGDGNDDIAISQNNGSGYDIISASGVSYDGGTTYDGHIIESTPNNLKKLAANDVISIAQTFADYGALAANPAVSGTQWNGTTNGYLGVQFLISGVVHYGWVRLDVNSTATGFTIKDFAYESSANTQILAGVTGSNPTGIFSVNKESSSITAFENIISLKGIAKEGTMAVFNSSGLEVFNTSVNQGDSSFPINGQGAGVYIVKVTTDNSILSKKIYLQN